MVAVIAGSGGTIKSLSLEEQLLEVFIFLRLQEKDAIKNQQNVNYVSGSFSITSDFFSGNFDIPIAFSLNDEGKPVIATPEYLTGIDFSPGSGGTFKSSTAAGYLVEIIQTGQILEANSAKNPQGRNYLTGNYSSDNSRFTGSVSIPVIFGIDNEGKIYHQAVEYLVA